MSYTFLIVLAAFAIFVAAPVLITAAYFENRSRNAASKAKAVRATAPSPEHARAGLTPRSEDVVELHRSVFVALKRLEDTSRLPQNVLPLRSSSEPDPRQWSREVSRVLSWSAARTKEQAKA